MTKKAVSASVLAAVVVGGAVAWWFWFRPTFKELPGGSRAPGCESIAQVRIDPPGEPSKLLYLDTPIAAGAPPGWVIARREGETAWHNCNQNSICDGWVRVDKIESVPGPDPTVFHFQILVTAVDASTVDVRFYLAYPPQGAVCHVVQSFDVTPNTVAVPSKLLTFTSHTIKSAKGWATDYAGSPFIPFGGKWAYCGDAFELANGEGEVKYCLPPIGITFFHFADGDAYGYRIEASGGSNAAPEGRRYVHVQLEYDFK